MAQHPVCRADELAVGQHRLFEVAGTKLIVYHLDDGFFATQANCTHIFAPLAKGKLVDGCKIQCPFHRARFDVRTGKVVDWANWPPGIVNVLNAVRGEKDLATYKVAVHNGQVSVEV
jgi:3-phenylpropionate/trans-cinnamate dioxygenase ferredoxin component